MKLIDVSWPISEGMTEYKNKDSVHFTNNKDFPEDGVRDSEICLNAHTGTHVDAPAHFLETGGMVESLLPDDLYGECIVIETTDPIITRDSFSGKDVREGDIVLLKTTNSSLAPDAPFEPEFVFLDSSGAEFLSKKKIKSVGIDYLGIERSQPGHETHKTLMNAGIIIIEGLRLEKVAPGRYTFLCLPLRLEGIEAAPARAILFE